MVVAMDDLSGEDVERMKKLWKQLEGFSPTEGFADGLLEELFYTQEKSLRDSIRLVSTSINRRRSLAVHKREQAQDRQNQIVVALDLFPMVACYSHLEARRSQRERELDELLRELQHEEVSALEDLHQLYQGLIYLAYKLQTLGTVKKAVKDAG